jgi:hypothetical protein
VLSDLAESTEPENRIIVQFTDGSTRVYGLYKAKDGREWLLKTSDREELFELSSYLGSRLGEQLVVDKLIKTEATEDEVDASDASEVSQEKPSEADGGDSLVESEETEL